MSDPLTDAEIAELREWLRDYDEPSAPPFALARSSLVSEERQNREIVESVVPRLLAEVERSRALLKQIEAVPDEWCDDRGCNCEAASIGRRIRVLAALDPLRS